MLQDSFGRRFYYLRLSVTDVCNFRCSYCLPDGYQGKPDEAFLSASELEAAVRGFAQMGTQKIRLTGGEPGLRSDLPEIIYRLNRIDGINNIAVTTNGYKLPQRIQHWADAGLNHLNVSIDSLDSSTFHEITGHDRLAEVLEGLAKARELGLTVKVNAVLMKGVNDDLAAVLTWLKQTPVTLRFIEVMETSDQAVFFRQYHVRGDDIRQSLLSQGWQPVLRDVAAGPAQEFWHPDYAGRIGLIMPYSQDFCATCNRLRISSLGKLHLCLFAEQGIDIRPYLQTGVPTSELVQAVSEYVQGKKATHALQSHNSGAMANLSQIGG
ncbi:GTP 3',8-cyclase MoaA [Reinekea blandensis]|uniref:GTP 3',8-cyclase n=1 Tax=Reinekea blandensis MED297 TaxID=314283 RepID=A4BI38_9GAMM|nr:GTP 3',8-cyclase MoaA [Reinekea blandensis]EAR08181.1 Molybdenum cofactor biosynthesis enzyme [Reinekea sp. MED297] [Reinekea blandensis MED297]